MARGSLLSILALFVISRMTGRGGAAISGSMDINNGMTNLYFNEIFK